MIFDRMTPMYGQDMARPYGRDTMRNGGINPNGMYTGGNMRPQVGLPPMGGPGRSFQVPQFQTGGNAPPMQTFGLQTGGQLPPMQQNPWMTGGNQPPQSSLSRWFNTFRQGAYR